MWAKAGAEPVTSGSAIHLTTLSLLPVLQFSIRRKDEHPFAELHIDIDDGKQKGSVIVSNRRNSGHAALDAAFSNNS